MFWAPVIVMCVIFDVFSMINIWWIPFCDAYIFWLFQVWPARSTCKWSEGPGHDQWTHGQGLIISESLWSSLETSWWTPYTWRRSVDDFWWPRDGLWRLSNAVREVEMVCEQLEMFMLTPRKRLWMPGDDLWLYEEGLLILEAAKY